MARIRTIKPELARHELMFELEKEAGLPLRFAWAMLPTACDREGRFKWRPHTLKLDVLPYDDLDFSRVLDAWLTRGFIVKYACAGQWYGYIPTWKKHQVINHREKSSDIPDPSTAERIEDFTKQELPDASATRQPRVSHASPELEGNARGEGKGREGKGREGEGENTLSGKPDRDDTTTQIFKHWQSVMQHPTAHLDAKRKRIISAALKTGYTPAQLCLAIDGCARTPHNMGQNDRQTVYDGLHIILKPENIDRFISAASRPLMDDGFGDGFSALSPAGQQTARNLADWTPPPDLEDTGT